MKTSLLKLLLLAAALACGALTPRQTAAQTISYPGGTITEDFNNLGPAGTTTAPGWFVGYAGPTNLNVIGVSDGSIAPDGTAAFNFGGAGNPDRSLGTAPTSVGSPAPNDTRWIEARFRNNSGQPFTNLTVHYDGEQWRAGSANTVNILVMRVSVDGVNYVNLGSSFDFVQPTFTPFSSALDGNQSTNRTPGIGGTFSLASPLPPGGTLFLRWFDANETGTDPALAIDNFSFSAAGTPPPPPTVALTSPANGTGFLVGDNATVAATAQDASGVAFVDFFDNGGFRFRDTNAPYSITEGDLTAGTHTLLAISRGNGGINVTSVPVIITVTNEPGFSYLVPNGSVWKYLDDGSDQGTNWREPNFIDSGWSNGVAELGFGDDAENPPRPERTVINGGPATNRYVTTYFRHTFTVANPAAYSGLIVRLLRDDGGVAYLNGVEVFRSNMPTGAVNYATLTGVNATDDGTAYFSSTNLSPALLVAGPNVLAVEIHQSALNSSDLSFDAMLVAEPSAPPGCIPPPPGLVLWLPFDETSGTSAQNLAGGNHGTLVNGPTFNSGSYVSNSLCFDGVDDYVQVPTYPAIEFGTGDFTVDAWVKPGAPSGPIWAIVGHRELILSPLTVRGYVLLLWFDNSIAFQLGDGSDWQNFESSLVVPFDNQWHHIAVTVKRGAGGVITAYLDGVPQIIGTPYPGSVTPPPTIPLYVGGDAAAPATSFNGCIDEVELFNRELAPAEIAALYNAGSAGKCSPPANCLPFAGLEHCPIGAASLSTNSNSLLLSNLGSSGQDGVEIHLPAVAAWEGHWMPLDPTDALPVGAYLQSQAHGTAGSVSNGLLGSWQLTKTGISNFVVSFDFAPLGATGLTLQVYSGTNLVATTNSPMGTLVNLYGGFGCVDDDHWGRPVPTGPGGLPGPWGGGLTMFGPQAITFPSGWTVLGDRLVVLPEGGPTVRSLSAVKLLASNIPQLVITNERVTLTVGGYHNAALDYLRTHGVLMTNIVRATSNHVAQLASGVGDYLLSAGFNPTEVAAAVSGVLQNLNQANAFYVDSGVVYFGFPVPTDQVAPYLAARLQAAGRVSSTFVERFRAVNDMFVSNAAPSAILTYLTDTFAGSFTNAADNLAAAVFTDVFASSLAYWTNSGNFSLAKPCPTCVIWADAAGALYGLLLGPIGSIIYGAIFSSIAEANNNSALARPLPDVVHGGLPHSALETAGLDVQQSRVLVYPREAGTAFGVGVGINRAVSCDAFWRPLDPAGISPLGSRVQLDFTGSILGVANRSLGYASVTHATANADGFEIRADLTPLGSPSVRVEVWRQGVSLGVFPGQPAGLVARASLWPIGGGKLGLGEDRWVLGCIVWRWPIPNRIWVNGTEFMADELRMLQESPAVVDYLSGFAITAAEIPELVITNERVTLTVGGYHNAALDYLRTHGVLMTNIVRATSNHVAQLASGVGDYLLSAGFNPTEVAAAVSGVLQNLNQANAFYVDSGVVYFGFPVPTDQVAPYLAARLQAAGRVSSTFVERFRAVNDMFVSNAAPSAILTYLTDTFAGSFTNAADNLAAAVFTDVFASSLAYWTNSGNFSLAKPCPTCSIWFDALGTFLTLELGPGSILGGAIMSDLAERAFNKPQQMVQPLPGVTYGSITNTALGTAGLDIRQNRLVVYPRSVDTSFGVGLNISQAVSCDISWQPIDLYQSSPLGASLQLDFTGSVNGVANRSLGYARVTHVSTNSNGYNVIADLTPIASPTVRVEVWSQGALLATFPGLPTGVVAQTRLWPIGGGKTGRSFPPYILGCLSFCYPWLTDIWVNGNHFMADQLLMLQESPPSINYLSGVSVSASNILDITITQETVVPLQPTLAAVLSGTNVVVSWPVEATNFNLEEAANLQGTNTVWGTVTNAPVVVGGNYQVTLPASHGTRFFRLRGPAAP